MSFAYFKENAENIFSKIRSIVCVWFVRWLAFPKRKP